MRKFLLLFAAMLSIVGIGKMNAEVITSASQLSNTKVYTIKTTRGYMTLNTAQTMIVSSHKSDGGTVNDDAATDDESKQFGIIKYDGKYFIYSPKLNKFACIQGQNLYMKTDRGVALNITTDGSGNPDGSTLRFFAQGMGSEGYNKWCLNNNNSGSLVLNSYTGAEAGNTVSIEEVAGATLDIDAAMAVFNGAPYFYDMHKVYNITNDRITKWTANSGNTGLTGISTYSDASAGQQQFAFFKYDGKQYLYNVGAKKFVGTNGSLTSSKGDAATIAVWYTGNSNYPYCFYIEERGLLFNAQGSGGFAINAWNSGLDEGNRHNLVEVAGVDVYNEILAYFEVPSWDVTYNIYYNGEKIGEEVRNQDKDSQAEVSSAWTNDFVTFTYSPSTISTGVTSVDVTVNWSGPTLYSDYSSIVWQNLYIDRGDDGKFYLANTGDTNNFLVKNPTENKRASSAYQWGFVGTPYQLKIYNKKAGSGQTLHPNNAIEMADGDSYWSIKINYNNGFMIGKTGNVNSFINQAGGSTSTKLGFWGSTTDAGNVFKMEAAPNLSVTDVYYDISYKGSVVETFMDPGVEMGSALAIPTNANRDYVQLSAVSGTVTEEDQHVAVTATWNGPFNLSETVAGADWYYARLRDTKYLRADDNNKDDNGRYTTSTTNEKTDAYQWAFLGNPYHIYIANKAHSGKYLYYGSQPEMKELADPASDTKALWTIATSNDGFSVRSQSGNNLYINDAGGAGNLGNWNSGNGANDGGSKWIVSSDVDVTFEVIYGGNVVASATANQETTTAPQMPSVLNLGSLVTYSSPTPEKIPATANPVVTYTITGTNYPFELATDVVNAHWYDMAVRGNYYVTSDNLDSDNALAPIEANALGLAEDAYQWAFVGTDPYHIKLYNKAQGDSKVYAWTGNSNSSIPAFVDAANGNYWWIRKSTASGDDYANAFMLTIPNDGYQVNQFGGSFGSLKIWADTRTYDVGSAFTIFDVPDDFAAYADAEIKPYVTLSGNFALKDAVKANIGWQDSYSTTCPFATYKAMKEALAAIDLTDINNYNMPSTGYYRMKSAYYNGYYLTYTEYEGNPVIGSEKDAAESVTSIVKLTALGNNTYTLTVGGLNATAPTQSNKVGLSKTGAEFTAVVSKPGVGTFTAGTTYGALHSANSQKYNNDNGYYVVGWTNDAAASQWTLEDATINSISASISDAGYATFNALWPVTIPGGVKAYTATTNGSTLTMTEVTGTIPAATPVVLEGAAGSYTFNFTDDVTAVAENNLVGTYTRIDAPNGSYILQNQNDKVGFYQVDTSVATPGVPANRAYLSVPASSNPVKAFYFEDATDAIQNVFEGISNGEIYNLAGQRIGKLQKGVNIVNGKKVMVK